MEYEAAPPDTQHRVNDSQLWPVPGFAAYNALLLGLLLFSDFNGYDLLVVIYLELCVIGLFALLRLGIAIFFGAPFESRHANVSRGATILLGVGLGGFFVAKFGGLMLLLGLALTLLPGDELGAGWADATRQHPLVELCVWVLLVRYAIMFLWFTVMHGDYRHMSVVRLLLAPYINGLWAVVTLGAGAFLAFRYPHDPMLFATLGVFAAKLVLDLVNLLLELRRVRLAPETEARRKRRDARERKVSRWLPRALAATLAATVAGFVIFAARNIWSQVQLEDALEERGVVLTGTVESKSMSAGSGSSSDSYSVRVTYTHGQLECSNPCWIRRSRWELLDAGDPIEISVLPEDPGRSQLAEYVGTSINGRGFIPLRARAEGNACAVVR